MSESLITTCLVLGIVLLLFALIGKIDSEYLKIGTDKLYVRIIAALLSAVLLTVVVISALPSRHTKLEGNFLKISTTEVSDKHDSLHWLTNRIEHSLAEYLSQTSVKVISKATNTNVSNIKQYFDYRGTLTVRDNTIVYHYYINDINGRVVCSNELKGDLGFFQEISAVLPEVVIYSLDIQVENFKPKRSKNLPTTISEAYAYYLLARNQVTKNKTAVAIESLGKAISLDSSFAMAYWAKGCLKLELGDSLEGLNNKKLAAEINADHPRLPYRDPKILDRPLEELQRKSIKTKGASINKGIEFKKIVVDEYDFQALFWEIDPLKFNISIDIQTEPYGDSLMAFVKRNPKAILLINGGFWDRDSRQRLTQAGLLVITKESYKKVSEKGGSGILCVKDNVPKIVYKDTSKDYLDCDFAVQAGPMLIDYERGVKKCGIVFNDFNRLNRTVIGTKGKKLAVLIIHGGQGNGLSLYELSNFLLAKESEGGLNWDYALNFGGGPSTQAYFHYEKYFEYMPGLWRNNNVIVVSRR